MSIRNVINKEKRLILTTGEGIITFADMRASQEEILADPNYNPAFNQLIDGRKVTQVSLTEEQAWILARRCMVSKTSRRAVVASSPAIFGVGRLMEVHHEFSTGVQVEVFGDLAAAMQWLESEQEQPDAVGSCLPLCIHPPPKSLQGGVGV
jgi:hypothetical protein